jgi:hypothetical protein
LSTEKQSFQVLKLLCRFARDFATIQQLWDFVLEFFQGVSCLEWLVQEADALNCWILLLNILKASNFKINPSLYINHTKEEVVSELLIFIFVKSSADQMYHQSSVLI